jgi:hypothetical protein
MEDTLMTKICDLTEIQLNSANIFYVRNGTVFSVKEKDIPILFDTQTNVTISLIQKGELTMDMALNFLEKGSFK